MIRLDIIAQIQRFRLPNNAGFWLFWCRFANALARLRLDELMRSPLPVFGVTLLIIR